MEAVKLSNVTYFYPNSNKPALDGVNLEIKYGEFILIIGPSGCGKSSLLRIINGIIPNFYGGKIKGEVLIKGKKIEEYKNDELFKKIGFVFQDPEKQIIFNSVEKEIAFGMQNIGFELKQIKRNIAEACAFLGINNIRNKNTQNISGGEKQKVEIASVISMDPEIILFDEPTSQLDPISSEEVINSIIKLNRDLGKTIIVVEQRIDRFIEFTDRIIYMTEGRSMKQYTKDEIRNLDNNIFILPQIAYIFKEAGYSELPFTIKEAQSMVKKFSFNHIPSKKEFNDTVLTVENLNFDYSIGERTLKDINFTLKGGEIVGIMGQNGAGKTTLFKIIAGLINNYRGRVKIYDKDFKEISSKEKIKLIGYLAQNPNLYFGRETVFEEVAYSLRNVDKFSEEKVFEILMSFNLLELMEKNPRDLSGGQKQRLAICCTTVIDPEILILDEPTRGIDILQKKMIGEFVKNYASKGKTVVIITHDSDFVGDYCDSVILMFDGEIVTQGPTYEVLSQSIYYSPQVTKLFKNKCKIVNSRDAIELIRKTL